MGLAEKIQARIDSIEDECENVLPLMAEVFATELRVTLGKKGTRENPSAPGEAPHRVSGVLIDSIVTEVYPEVAYVGPTAFYASILKPTRPFYQITADKIRQRMRDLLDDL